MMECLSVQNNEPYSVIRRISGHIVNKDDISIQLWIVSQLNLNLELTSVVSQFNFRWCLSSISIRYSYMYIRMVSQIGLN